MKRPRSSTVVYMLPAGAVPRSKVGAGKVRLSSVHMYALAILFCGTSLREKAVLDIPMGSRTTFFR